MSKYKVTIGADPEFFVIDEKTMAVQVACRKFGGEKGAPLFLSPDGGYLEDGCAVEFNVTPSATLAQCKKKLEGLQLIFLAKNPGWIFSRSSHANFPQEELEKYTEARCIGCSPDLFAYGLRKDPSIEAFGQLRFAGGHIHLGIDPWPEGLEKQLMVKAMDQLLVFPAATCFVNKARYPFYGHPGLYRETSYGIEHRSPDNWWCNSATALTGDQGTIASSIIKLFDEAVHVIKALLDMDGHGARLNQELGQYLSRNGVDALMSTIPATEDWRSLLKYRYLNAEISETLKQMLHGRTTRNTSAKRRGLNSNF